MEAAEQVGRISCFGFMVLTVPGWWTQFPVRGSLCNLSGAERRADVAYLLIFALNFPEKRSIPGAAGAVHPALGHLPS